MMQVTVPDASVTVVLVAARAMVLGPIAVPTVVAAMVVLQSPGRTTVPAAVSRTLGESVSGHRHWTRGLV